MSYIDLRGIVFASRRGKVRSFACGYHLEKKMEIRLVDSITHKSFQLQRELLSHET